MSEGTLTVIELLDKLEGPLSALDTATDAVESLEDDYADVARDRGTYAILVLIREKLRTTHQAIAIVCNQARQQTRQE